VVDEAGKIVGTKHKDQLFQPAVRALGKRPARAGSMGHLLLLFWIAAGSSTTTRTRERKHCGFKPLRTAGRGI